MRRFGLVVAVLGLVAGVTGRAKADLDLTTPAGLNPGDSFLFVFVTDGTTNATSSNDVDYNSFVQSQAGGATYNGLAINWQAIVSTPGLLNDAIFHLGGQTPVPVYLVDGTMVAQTATITAGGLWSGSLLHSIDEDIAGTIIDTTVWTGTGPDGMGTSDPLGSTSTTYGSSISTDSGWIDGGTDSSTTDRSLYGISGILTVPAAAAVPEPSTLGTVGTGILAGLAYGWSRQRRDQRRRGPAIRRPEVTE